MTRDRRAGAAGSQFFLLPLVALLLHFAGPGSAHAQSAGAADPERSGSPALLGFSFGWVEPLMPRGEAAAIEFQYHGTTRLARWFRPQSGFMMNTDGAAFVYGGVYVPIAIRPGVTARISFGPGLYDPGTGRDLGSVLEFRTAVGVVWRVARRHHLSVFLYHLSNAGMGRSNPGAEVLTVGYSVPW